jgi:hypothetical protein
LRRHKYKKTILFHLEYFWSFQKCWNFYKQNSKTPMFPLSMESKDMFFQSWRIWSLLGKHCKCCEHCDPMPNLLEVFIKSFWNLMHCCCGSPQDLWVWNSLNNSPSFLKWLILGMHAKTPKEDCGREFESWAHGNSVTAKSLTTLELLLFVHECTW